MDTNYLTNCLQIIPHFNFNVLDRIPLFSELKKKNAFWYGVRMCSLLRFTTSTYKVYSTCMRGCIFAGIRGGCVADVKLNFNFAGLAREKSFELFDKECSPAGFFLANK